MLGDPFHPSLLGLAGLFLLTSLAYLVSGFVLEPLDRSGPLLMAVEPAPMLPAAAPLVAFDRRMGRARRRRTPRR